MGQGQAKFDYGTHETEVCKPDNLPESDYKNISCKKDHDKYISLKDLTLDLLPEPYRENDFYDLIKSMAGLTVRINVQYSSLERVKYWQETEAEYPGYDSRGLKVCLIGSGRICDVFQDKENKIECPCDECKSSDRSSDRDVWNIWVFTASHVVHNSIEAEHSQYKFFYDTGDGHKEFYGVKKLWSNVTGDLILLMCVTCDKVLADSLLETIKLFNKSWKNIRKRYEEDKKLKLHERKYYPRLVIVVSHPHGLEKKVSFGDCLGKEKKSIGSDVGWHINYNVSTCAGSSGAPVYMYGQDYFKTEYVHSGSNTECNYSTTWCPEKK